MIELRFLERKVEVPNAEASFRLWKTERILQQRTLMVTEEWKNKVSRKWTEWQDVPVVAAP
jgi:hypothetical protein